MESLYTWGEGALGLSRMAVRDIWLTMVALAVWVAVRRFVVRPLSRRFDDAEGRYTAQKTGNAAITVLLVAFLAAIWFGSYGLAVLEFAGIFAAGLAIALKEPISNFAGWIYIVIRRPFRLQDRVQVGNGVMGDVVDQRLFMFSLLEVGGRVDAEQSTGRIIHVPNGVVFNETIANHTQGFEHVWNEIAVTVTFESDWRRAHELLTEIGMNLTADMQDEVQRQIDESSTDFLVHYTQLNSIVWVRGVDIGVRLTLRYMCKARTRRVTESQLWQLILDAFNAQDGIAFALPTQRYASER